MTVSQFVAVAVVAIVLVGLIVLSDYSDMETCKAEGGTIVISATFYTCKKK